MRAPFDSQKSRASNHDLAPLHVPKTLLFPQTLVLPYAAAFDHPRSVHDDVDTSAGGRELGFLVGSPEGKGCPRTSAQQRALFKSSTPAHTVPPPPAVEPMASRYPPSHESLVHLQGQCDSNVHKKRQASEHWKSAASWTSHKKGSPSALTFHSGRTNIPSVVPRQPEARPRCTSERQHFHRMLRLGERRPSRCTHRGGGRFLHRRCCFHRPRR